jgi:hypothetical protein
MTLTVSDFELSDLLTLSEADVQQVLAQVSTQLQELHPELQINRGVFRSTLVMLHAVLETAIRTNLERYQSARSLQQIQADPSLADAGVVDEVLSNWGVTRKIGTKATGSVTIELNAARSVVIPQGFGFEANGKSYVAIATFTARTTAAQVSTANDRLLLQLSNGNWAFVVDVEASDSGSEWKLNANELIVPSRSLVNYVTSYATSTFSDGTNTETNEVLLNELQLGIAAKTISNRTNMRAWLRALPEFAGVSNQSIIGYGDSELPRAEHTIFPIRFPGKVDWYVRTQPSVQRLTTAVTATLISISGTKGTWQFSLGKNAAPGFYEVGRIRRAADPGLNSGFGVTEDIRAVDLTGSGFIPDIENVAEGAYTAFQTATIRFVDSLTNASQLAIGSTAAYSCEIVGLPLISTLQALVSDRDTRSYGADALIKAPVPCFVQVTLTINKSAGDPDPDVNSIKNAVADVINQTDFTGRLDGSRVIDAVHNYLTDDLSVTNLDLFGRIRHPGGSVEYLRGPDSLIVKDQPDAMVTAKTVQFFAEAANITVNVATTIPTAT